VAHQGVLPTLAEVTLPTRLLQIVEVFAGSPKEFRVQALLDFGNRIPPLPDDLAADRQSFEQVHECATPFFLATRVEPDGAVRMFFEAPPESPTVRGFAGILHAGLDGEPADAVLAVPDDFFYGMGLEEVVTPQRLRGMAAILARLKRQIRERRPTPAT
jgi:cysteine desulfuration protein SufE